MEDKAMSCGRTLKKLCIWAVHMRASMPRIRKHTQAMVLKAPYLSASSTSSWPHKNSIISCFCDLTITGQKFFCCSWGVPQQFTYQGQKCLFLALGIPNKPEAIRTVPTPRAHHESDLHDILVTGAEVTNKNQCKHCIQLHFGMSVQPYPVKYFMHRICAEQLPSEILKGFRNTDVNSDMHKVCTS